MRRVNFPQFTMIELTLFNVNIQRIRKSICFTKTMAIGFNLISKMQFQWKLRTGSGNTISS